MVSTESFAIRIRSLGRVKDNIQDSSYFQQRSATPYKNQRLSQYKQFLQKQVNNFLPDSYFN
ncbi:unnamed protein product [Paramecium octaurelia]|uniref:Uncharacterized protein n=1 Tax=Paramecium octaurelia TaxID=43137 RepID=A0A8S1XRZ8_PAROT|nr:unnamed protein product [Paramecium octaurelia]